MAITIPKPAVDVKDIDAGFYADAAGAFVPSPTYLAEKSPAPPEFVKGVEDKFLAANSQYQENPHMREAESPLHQWAEGRAALSHQLTWYEQQKGTRVITVADFYGPDSAIQSLFPAWIESEIQAALINTGIVSWLVFGQEQVDSETVRAIYDSSAEWTRTMKKVLPGGELPSVKLTFADSDIYLYKYGAAIEASYEVVKHQKIDALGHHIRRVAEQVAVDETDTAMDVLIGGDTTTAGSAESDSTDVDVDTAGAIAYSDMLSWVFGMSQPYQIDKAIAGATDLALINNLAEFKDADSGGLAGLPGPKTIDYKWWDGGVTGSNYVDRLVVGIDSRKALKAYRMGGLLQETDKIITRQTNVWTFSSWVGFRKFDASAVKVLDTNTAL